MPTKTVAVETMEVGKKGGGKHWTKREIAARKAAAAEMQRDGPVILEPPRWLNDHELEIWRTILEQAKGLALFDNLDRETLAVYCNAVVEHEKCARLKRRSVDRIKEQQAWARSISQLSDKLGLNPSARARLIKKKADKKLDQFGDQFD
jgi:P27 family predicted phage terminase small subunit